MASLQEQIKAARAAGMSEDQIAAKLREKGITAPSQTQQPNVSSGDPISAALERTLSPAYQNVQDNTLRRQLQADEYKRQREADVARSETAPAKEILVQLRDIAKNVNTEDDWKNAYKKGLHSSIIGRAQQDPWVSSYYRTRGKLSTLIRALGEKGTLAEGDVQRAQAAMPKLWYTRENAERSIKEIEDIITKKESVYQEAIGR